VPAQLTTVSTSSAASRMAQPSTDVGRAKSTAIASTSSSATERRVSMTR